jgi:hypothetical protein
MKGRRKVKTQKWALIERYRVEARDVLSKRQTPNRYLDAAGQPSEHGLEDREL